MQSESQPNRAKLLLFIALILIVVGGLLANLTQTNRGKVHVRDIRFVGAHGVVMSAVPEGPAPKPGYPINRALFFEPAELAKETEQPASLYLHLGEHGRNFFSLIIVPAGAAQLKVERAETQGFLLTGGLHNRAGERRNVLAA
jgi:hypothetical protein